MANLIDLIIDTTEYVTGLKSIMGELKGTIKGEEITITFDQVTGLQPSIAANLSNYSVGEGSVVSDYYAVGQKTIQLSGFFSTWQGKDLISEFLIPSILERDKTLENFMRYKCFLTLKVSYFTYENLMITSYNMEPSDEAHMVNIEMVLAQVQTFKFPKEVAGL